MTTDERRVSTPTIEIVEWDDPRAVSLRAAMDAEIGPRYAGRKSAATAEENAIIDAAFALDPRDIVATFIALDGDVPVAHAALRRLGTEWELKRLVTLAGYRGRGISRALIASVELEVVRRGGSRVILQTGDRQPEAVGLYEALGYVRIPTFEPYTVFSGSICFAHAV
ncbi:GNAT family N-acetyltransferase [Glaciihabitans sp. dw_435]|uniref:GNAT family N-acetyltransferase n=1 Tax=Glaciihabitans sp. dw_435 TaxID=2720081 RepID=UPI0027DDC4A7|nr:GNAT family N-acetyltransferase [Glaciihabitans sp. dw_435]